MPNTIKAVFFDVDGTLAATTSLGFSATNAILLENGYNQISEAEYKVGTRYTTPERLAWHATGGLDGGDTTDVIGHELGAKFDELYVGLVSLETAGFFPGMKELCQHLQSEGCHIGALSNACGAYVVAVLVANGVSDMFHPQLGADNVPMPKPAPDGLLQCCQMVDAAPSECIYIGDAPSDGLAARAAGMHCIGVTWGSHERASCESAFDELVDDVQALLQAVRARTSFMQMTPDQKSSSATLASMHQGRMQQAYARGPLRRPRKSSIKFSGGSYAIQDGMRAKIPRSLRCSAQTHANIDPALVMSISQRCKCRV